MIKGPSQYTIYMVKFELLKCMHGHVQWSIHLSRIIILHDYGLLHVWRVGIFLYYSECVSHIGLGFRFWIYCLNLDCFVMEKFGWERPITEQLWFWFSELDKRKEICRFYIYCYLSISIKENVLRFVWTQVKMIYTWRHLSSKSCKSAVLKKWERVFLLPLYFKFFLKMKYLLINLSSFYLICWTHDVTVRVCTSMASTIGKYIQFDIPICMMYINMMYKFYWRGFVCTFGNWYILSSLKKIFLWIY